MGNGRVFLCGNMLHHWGFARLDIATATARTVTASGFGGYECWLETESGAPEPVPPIGLLADEPEDSPVWRYVIQPWPAPCGRSP